MKLNVVLQFHSDASLVLTSNTKKVTSYQHLQVTCKLQLQVCKNLDCMGPHLFALALFVSLEGGSYHHLKPKKGQKKKGWNKVCKAQIFFYDFSSFFCALVHSFCLSFLSTEWNQNRIWYTKASLILVMNKIFYALTRASFDVLNNFVYNF